ncbi:MAG: carbamoyltransferase HypF, partial [Pseudanabaena sp.]
ILWKIFGDRLWDLEVYPLQSFTNFELNIYKTLLAKQGNLIQTSSMGRLFDAVAALLGICQVASFEGQAAIAIEQISDATTNDFYGMDVKNDGEIDWTNLI